ncbi:MAG: cytochrome C biosynthesis protein [Sphingomonas sp.]|uniref:tetratricopeptide repeat protein n=1 Tax=Sphingomonas sp. TaxID=28214 RepID=UPI001ACBD780|nr:cytochrome C biosynthesis protein [Sphingomonas sp.]MBN8816750.1 cytochrome C biosynthesis protein [Sphingomonas sp.]
MGWILLLLIGCASITVLWFAGLARGLWMFVASALMLGAAGYAWQQRATLPGHPVEADSKPVEIEGGLVAFREAIMPGKPGDARILTAADDKLREGNTEAAVQVMLDAIARDPGDAVLWAGLGSAVATHDGGQLSPTALFAFRRAMALGPDQPGPPFYLGMAYAQTGDLATAKISWLRALALTPRDAPYRIDIAEQLAMIDQFQAMNANAPQKR